MDQPTLAPAEAPVLDRGDRDEAVVVVQEPARPLTRVFAG
jgi:hypothetical protein